MRQFCKTLGFRGKRVFKESKTSANKLLLFLAAISLCCGIASAATTIYTSRSLWENAVGAYAEESFSDITLNPGVSVDSDLGSILGGVWNDAIGDETIPNGPSTTTWYFTPPIYAYGGNWDLAGPGGQGSSIRVYINSTLVGQIPNTYSGQFWGFVSTEPFDNVFLKKGTSTGWRELYEMDNMVYAFASGLELTKTDDVNEGDCVVPDRLINYTISYEFSGAGDTNVILTDYLPIDVDYNSSNPPGDYNDTARTVTWNIGTVPPDDNATFTLTCIVNYDAIPESIMTNICEIAGDSTEASAEVNTLICLWNEIIYVDCNAAGLDNGLTWEDAYRNLQNALVRAAVEEYAEIWVARGTYKPTVPSGSPTFQFIDSVPVYGHFAGNETSKGQRDLKNPDNETILSGINTSAPFVVTASGFAADNIIDGFTLLGAGTSGDAIKIENAYITVSNCVIEGASVAGYGIYAMNSGFKIIDCVIQDSPVGIYSNFQNNGSLPQTLIKNCAIRNNQTGIGLYNANPASPVKITNNVVYNNNYGVLLSLSSSTPVIKECLLFSNASGIYLNGSSASILNNWIYRNTQSGIHLYSAISPTTIRNNTIALNNQYGIYRYSGTAPVINSSIIWGNPAGDIPGCTALYSTITTSGDPCFVDADMNDFHIRPFSMCVNAGDPNFADFNEVDIDNQSRIMIGETIPRVDIGADEIGWPRPDYNRDEAINFTDYTILTSSWLTIDPERSLDDDEDVDIDDIAIFADFWLWHTPLWQ